MFTCAFLLSAHFLAAQTLEERVTHLEVQVAELWQLHDQQSGQGTTVPAELVGNEHLSWGYPGGDCTLLIDTRDL